MAIKINELLVVHSGGAANASPAASLGGAISTHANKRVVSQIAAAPTNITGVTMLDAYGNATGVGSLYYASGLLGGDLQERPYTRIQPFPRMVFTR